MVIMKLKLVEGNTKDKAAAATNVTAHAGYVTNGTKVLKTK